MPELQKLLQSGTAYVHLKRAGYARHTRGGRRTDEETVIVLECVCSCMYSSTRCLLVLECKEKEEEEKGVVWYAREERE